MGLNRSRGEISEKGMINFRTNFADNENSYYKNNNSRLSYFCRRKTRFVILLYSVPAAVFAGLGNCTTTIYLTITKYLIL